MIRSLKSILLAGVFIASSPVGVVADEADETVVDADVARLLKLRLGTDKIAPVEATRAPGVYQTRFGNRFAYLIEGGRYVFIGDMVDLQMAQNLTEMSRRELVVEELAAFDEDNRIIFPAVDEERAILNVFTDTSCGYCQQLHKEVGYLQDAGISVHYYPYPRGGTRGPGYGDLRRVWCAADQREAMGIAKGAADGTLAPDSGDCAAAAAIDQGYELGNRIGVTGTPAMYDVDGAAFPGYVPYQQLIPQLLGR